jgi:hypothetical protein
MQHAERQRQVYTILAAADKQPGMLCRGIVRRLLLGKHKGHSSWCELGII